MGKTPAKPRKPPWTLQDCVTLLADRGFLTETEAHVVRVRMLERDERAKRPKAKGGTRK